MWKTPSEKEFRLGTFNRAKGAGRYLGSAKLPKAIDGWTYLESLHNDLDKGKSITYDGVSYCLPSLIPDPNNTCFQLAGGFQDKEGNLNEWFTAITNKESPLKIPDIPIKASYNYEIPPSFLGIPVMTIIYNRGVYVLWKQKNENTIGWSV